MKILIALDESPVSARAAREAVGLFSRAGAHFLVVNVAAIGVDARATTTARSARA